MAIPVIGDRYGRLTVIEERPPRQERCGIKSRLVVVRCTCGTVKTVRLTNLRSGNTTSCGCKAAALASTRMCGNRLRMLDGR